MFRVQMNKALDRRRFQAYRGAQSPFDRVNDAETAEGDEGEDEDSEDGHGDATRLPGAPPRRGHRAREEEALADEFFLQPGLFGSSGDQPTSAREPRGAFLGETRKQKRGADILVVRPETSDALGELKPPLTAPPTAMSLTGGITTWRPTLVSEEQQAATAREIDAEAEPYIRALLTRKQSLPQHLPGQIASYKGLGATHMPKFADLVILPRAPVLFAPDRHKHYPNTFTPDLAGLAIGPIDVPSSPTDGGIESRDLQQQQQQQQQPSPKEGTASNLTQLHAHVSRIKGTVPWVEPWTLYKAWQRKWDMMQDDLEFQRAIAKLVIPPHAAEQEQPQDEPQPQQQRTRPATREVPSEAQSPLSHSLTGEIHKGPPPRPGKPCTQLCLHLICCLQRRLRHRSCPM